MKLVKENYEYNILQSIHHWLERTSIHLRFPLLIVPREVISDMLSKRKEFIAPVVGKELKPVYMSDEEYALLIEESELIDYLQEQIKNITERITAHYNNRKKFMENNESK